MIIGHQKSHMIESNFIIVTNAQSVRSSKHAKLHTAGEQKINNYAVSVMSPSKSKLLTVIKPKLHQTHTKIFINISIQHQSLDWNGTAT